VEENTGERVMERVAVYLRKSRADLEAEARGEGETLAKHRKTLLSLARKQGLNIVQIRQEIASGESLVNRPEMMALLKEVEAGEYDAVLCMDMDRLGRGSMQEQGLILETFRRSGTKIITPRKVYDLCDEWDEEYSEFEAFMARKELKIITRRLQRGKIQSLENGNYIASTPPYGYRIERDKQGGTLVPEPDEAEVVRMIFHWYTHDDPRQRMGSKRIADKLNEMGFKTRQGKMWQPSHVNSVLNKSVYAGMIRWRKVNQIQLKGGKKRKKQRPRDEWVEVKGRHEPLIDMQTYKKTQELLKSRAHSPYKRELSNPLAGLIRCQKCGWSIVKKTNNRQEHFLGCANIDCDNRSTRFDLVESTLLDVLKNWLEGYRLKWEPENKPGYKDDDEIKIRKKALKNLRSELATLEQQRERLHDLLERGIYDDETFMERSATLASRISDNKAAIAKAEQELTEATKRYKARKDIIPKVEHVLGLYPTTKDPKLKNALLKSILDRVEYKKDQHQKRSEFALDVYPKLPKTNKQVT
jgi:site-specific DNA recombinase